MLAKDYVAKRIKEETDVVFGITGGAIVNLFDSLHKIGIKIQLCNHEQACAMAADAYAKLTGKLGVIIVTSGPGGTNALTGICCSWFDSQPILIIAGQVPTKDLKKNSGKRQVGFQETDNIKIYESVTKYSDNLVSDIELEYAIKLAKSPRKGPVFLEFCDDIQREEWNYII